MSLLTWEALVSRLSYVASVPLWSRRTPWTGWSRDAHGSRGSWAPGNTWYTWGAKRSTITTRSIWWKWLSALCQKKKTKKKHAPADIGLLFLLKLIVKNSSFWESKYRAIFLLFVVYSEFLLYHSLLEWHWLTQSDEMMTMSMLGYIWKEYTYHVTIRFSAAAAVFCSIAKSNQR